MLLASVVTSTVPATRYTDEGIQRGSQKQQADELVSSDTAASTDMSDRSANLITVKVHFWQNLSDNYVTYIIEHKELPDEAAFNGADSQGVELLLANELATSQNVTFEGLLDKASKFKSVLLLFRPLNNFTQYTVQTQTSNNTTKVLVEAAVNSSLNVDLILMNQTNATQQVNTFLNNLNVTFINPPRTNHISVQLKVLLTNCTNSTNIFQKPELQWRKSKEYHILINYIDPTMYLLILVVGLLGNGMLLFIFIRHRKLRTAANLLIIHLVICDIINLSINAPLHFYFNYDSGPSSSLIPCRIVLAVREFLRSAAGLAVVTLIIQRFIIIHPTFIKLPSKRRTTFSFNIVSIITVWVLPLAIALPTMYVPKFYEPICNNKKREGLHFVNVLNLVLYCLIMPSLMFAFSTQIARRLNQSVKNIPGEIRHHAQQESRIRSARMMMALAVVFVITYFPFQMWVVLVRFVRVDVQSPIIIYSLHLTKQMHFANGCFNPIAMFAVSSTFRKMLPRNANKSSEKGLYNTRLWTAEMCQLILRYIIAHLQGKKRNTLCICFIYPNTVPVQFMNSVFTDNSSLLSLLVSGYGRIYWLLCLYLPQSNCPLKLKSPQWFWNIRNRQSLNGTPTHPRRFHIQGNGCENWTLQNGRQHLSLSSNDVVRSTLNRSWSVLSYFVVQSW